MGDIVMKENPKLPPKGRVALILAGIALLAYIGVFIRVYFFGP